MPAAEELQFASEALTSAAQAVKTNTGSFETVNQRLESAAESVADTNSQQADVATQLQDVLSSIEDVRTQDLAARLVVESGVVEGVEAPQADVEQLQTFTDQIEAYVTEVNEVQQQFFEGQINEVEAADMLNERLDTQIQKLEQRGEQMGLQNDQVASLQGIAQGLGDTGESVIEQSQVMLEFGAAIGETFGSFREAATQTSGAVQSFSATAQSALSNVTGFLSNPFVLAASVAGAAVGGIVDRFLELDKAAQSFLDETGFGAERAAQVRRQVAQLTPQLRMAGLEASDLVEATTTLADEFGSFQNAAQVIDSSFAGIQDPARALRTEITAVAGRLRISGQEAAELISKFESVAETTGTSRENLQRSAMSAAQIAGVAPQEVMNDIAESSEQLAKFSGASGEELASAAAQAKNLGTNIGEVAQLNEQILTDIPGFVQGLEKARTLAPQIGLDPNQLTQAAAQGPEALTAELEEQFEGVDVGNLDFFTKQRLSDAFGMSVQQLTRIGERAGQAAMSTEELTQKVQEGNASMQELFQATGAQTALTELQNQFGALIGTLSQAFVPVFEQVANGLSVLVSWLNQGMSALEEFSQPVQQTVSFILGSAGLVGAFKAVGAAFSTTGLTSLVPTLSISMSGLATAAGAVASSMASVAAPVLAIGSALVFFREPLMDAVQGLGSGLMPALEPISAEFGRLADVLQPVGTLFQDLFGAIMEGSGSVSWVEPTFRVIGQVLGTVITGSVRTVVSAIDIGIEAFRALGNTVGFITDIFTGDFSGAATNASQVLGSLGDIAMTVASTAFQNLTDIIASFFDFDGQQLRSQVLNALSSAFTGIPAMISQMLQSAGQAVVDAITPDIPALQRSMSQAASTIASYIPFSPAEQGPLANIDNANITGEIAKTIQPEPVQQQMETTMGEAQQAATDGLQPQQIDQSNQVQVEGATAEATAETTGIPEGAVSLLQEIANNEKQILAAIQNQELDAYMDSDKVTDSLRKNNNKNQMRL